MTRFSRVAVLSDIHGNLPALEAVLAEVDRVEADLIVLNGDLADGPFPVETLNCILALGRRAVAVRGNGDRWLIEAGDGRFQHPDTATDAITQWAASRLTEAHKECLRTLPLLRVVDHRQIGEVGVCHASARSDNEVVLVDSPLDDFLAALTGIDAPMIVLGHTHMPFDRLLDRRRVINAGSVGMPYGHDGASWLLIDDTVTLRRTHYDTKAAADRIGRSGMPGAAEFIRDYVITTPSDREALRVFRSISDRQRDSGSCEGP